MSIAVIVFTLLWQELTRDVERNLRRRALIQRREQHGRSNHAGLAALVGQPADDRWLEC